MKVDSDCEAAVPPRRGFFRLVGGAAAALVLLRSGLARAKKMALGLDKVAVLKEKGNSITLKIKGRPVMFVRDKEGGMHALDPTCTHKNCLVKYNNETGNLHCKCHKSAYTLGGKVLGGPAPKPLTVFNAKLDGERIILELPEKK